MIFNSDLACHKNRKQNNKNTKFSTESKWPIQKLKRNKRMDNNCYKLELELAFRYVKKWVESGYIVN